MGISSCTAYTSLLLARPGRGVAFWVAVSFGSLALFLAYFLISTNRTQISSDFLPLGIHCGESAIFLSIFPVSLLLWLIYKAAAIHPILSGGFAALASAEVAAITLYFSCSSDDGLHIFIWHFIAPMFLLFVSGALLGKKLLRW